MTDDEKRLTELVRAGSLATGYLYAMILHLISDPVAAAFKPTLEEHLEFIKPVIDRMAQTDLK